MPKPSALKIQMPGDESVGADEPLVSDESGGAEGEAFDDRDARIAQLEAEVAQLHAMVDHLSDQLETAKESAAAPTRVPEPPRLIGEDWSNMTSAQAKAKGCTERVLCIDGYFVPNVHQH